MAPSGFGARGRAVAVGAGLVFAVPALHPLLLPVVGVPSHLMWFAHVLPVGLLTYAFGARGAAVSLATSVVTVALGERLFGAGYGRPADLATVIALAVAVVASSALVAAFALLVRAAERRRQCLEEEARRGRTLAEIGTVVASIAHELNNPLAAVTAYADVIRSAEVPESLRADIDVMAHEAERAGKIARQLLRMARRDEQPRGVVRVDSVVERALRARAPSLAQHRITVRVKLAENLPAVPGVADEIEQVVLNLLTNAEHAMHEAHGQGVLSVVTRLESDWVVLAVTDDGPGVRADDLPRLFDAFFTTKSVGVGTGLGLSIARRIARAHGGDLAVASHPDRGATFTLTLRADHASRDAAVAPPIAPILVPLRVLVIDDEPSIRSALERLLRRQGHVARTAGGPLEALAAVSQERFDAVFCDVHLGEGSAAALYHDAVRLDATLAGRFVFSSGAALAPELCRLVEDSGSLHLAKPFETRDLLAALAHAARGSSAAATAS